MRPGAQPETTGICARCLDRIGAEYPLAEVSNDRSAPLPLAADPDISLAIRYAVPVLITAANPTRRCTYARLIHLACSTFDGPFIAFDDRGAPAGARTQATRLVEAYCRARRGTLFLADIVHLAAEAQSRILSLLDQAAAARFSTTPTDPPVRIISGASRHLDLNGGNGAFCDRLFYRLNVVHVDISGDK